VHNPALTKSVTIACRVVLNVYSEDAEYIVLIEVL